MLRHASTFWRALSNIEKTSHICTCLNTHSTMRMLGIVCSLILNMLMCHVAFALVININQSACSTLDWVMNNQSYHDQVLYKHHLDFPKHNRGNFKVLMPLLTHLSNRLLFFLVIKRATTCTSINRGHYLVERELLHGRFKGNIESITHSKFDRSLTGVWLCR